MADSGGSGGARRGKEEEESPAGGHNGRALAGGCKSGAALQTRGEAILQAPGAAGRASGAPGYGRGRAGVLRPQLRCEAIRGEHAAEIRPAACALPSDGRKGRRGRAAGVLWRAGERASGWLGERGDLRSEERGDAFLRCLGSGIQNASNEWVIRWSR